MTVELKAYMVTHPEDELRFQTIRDQLEQAIKIEQRKNIIIVPSHWYYNGQDTSLKVRELNNLPLNTIEEMNQGIFDISWCERYQSDGSLEQLLGQITPDNVHSEIDFGQPVGKELL